MSGSALAETVACRIAACEQVSADVQIVTLEAAAGEQLFAWRAGQFARFHAGDLEPRDYSIANPAGSGRLELHVRRSGNGGLSDHICDRLGVGDEISVAGPFGGAYYRARHGGPLLAIAGGTGLAPMKAIVEAALAGGLTKDVHLYFGVNAADELYLERYFIDLMHQYNGFRFIAVVNDPEDASGRRHGLVGDAVAADFQLLYGHQCYIAGPPQMAEACRDMLRLKSVPPHDMFSDAFLEGGTGA